MRASKTVFGDNWRLSPLVGKPFTQEEVRDQQPYTEEYHDPEDLDPAMFPAAPTSAPQQATREGELPRVKPPPPGLVIRMPTVKLQSVPAKAAPVPPEAVTAAAKAKAAAEEIREEPAASTSSQLPSRASLTPGRRRAYFMDDHLPEYEYTLVVNADGLEVPAINFNGTCYELELIKAKDVKPIQRACNVDPIFKKYATRVNKVCRGTASCSGVPMDKDLFRGLCKSLPQGSASQSSHQREEYWHGNGGGSTWQKPI